jgi:hypothetical protein
MNVHRNRQGGSRSEHWLGADSGMILDMEKRLQTPLDHETPLSRSSFVRPADTTA